MISAYPEITMMKQLLDSRTNNYYPFNVHAKIYSFLKTTSHYFVLLTNRGKILTLVKWGDTNVIGQCKDISVLIFLFP